MGDLIRLRREKMCVAVVWRCAQYNIVGLRGCTADGNRKLSQEERLYSIDIDTAHNVNGSLQM
jgi:hypothetical protein